MSYCAHSFFFLQDYLLPGWRDMGDLKETISKYAADQPIKFTALLTFTILAGIPIITFLSYSAVTLIVSLVGAILVELFLLVIGISALIFVLVFVSCATVCVTALFSVVYYFLVAATSIGWGKVTSFRTSRLLSGSTRVSERDEDDESFDKSKLRGPLEIGRMSQNFVSSYSTELVPKSHDFLRTCIITLFLVSVIFVLSLCILFTAFLVVSFT